MLIESRNHRGTDPRPRIRDSLREVKKKHFSFSTNYYYVMIFTICPCPCPKPFSLHQVPVSPKTSCARDLEGIRVGCVEHLCMGLSFAKNYSRIIDLTFTMCNLHGEPSSSVRSQSIQACPCNPQPSCPKSFAPSGGCLLSPDTRPPLPSHMGRLCCQLIGCGPVSKKSGQRPSPTSVCTNPSCRSWSSCLLGCLLPLPAY